jgi:hypothetical protein
MRILMLLDQDQHDVVRLVLKYASFWLSHMVALATSETVSLCHTIPTSQTQLYYACVETLCYTKITFYIKVLKATFKI